MTSPERFARIQKLFHAALNLSPAARQAFLRDKCRADDSLRQEIELLIAEDARHSGFVETGFPGIGHRLRLCSPPGPGSALMRSPESLAPAEWAKYIAPEIRGCAAMLP